MASSTVTVSRMLQALALASFLVLTAGVLPQQVNSSDKVNPNVVIVQFPGKPTALGGKAALIQKQHTGFLGALRQRGLQHTVRFTFRRAINAISLYIAHQSDAAAMAKLPDVTSVTFAKVYHIPDESKAVFDLTAVKAAAAGKLNFKPEHDVTEVTQVQELNITGTGVKVGIIDTGIDYTHPGFGACAKIGATCRVAYGYDFVGDDYDSDSSDPAKRVPHPDPDPMDCNGHGTHVAGIVGAKDDVLVGVAPDVTFGAYRIFGCEGNAADDVIIAAMEAAYDDGMDIINLSLGGGSTWPQDHVAKVADVLTYLGLIVVSALGNEGTYGLWTASSPGLSTRGFGVGSIDNTKYPSSTLQVLPSNRSLAYYVDSSQYQYLTDGPVKVSSTDVSIPDDGCNPYSTTFFAGKIALIRRGTCFFVTKARNAQSAGAIGVIIYNNRPGVLSLSAVASDILIAVAGIQQEDGVTIIQDSKTVEQSIHWLDPTDLSMVPNPSALQVSYFSSWGLSPDLMVKPDIAAPGGLIYSTTPLALGGYALYSGTSMATPYVAGIAALYKAAKKRRIFSLEVKQAIQNAAVPVVPGTAPLSSVAQEGAGLVNALHTVHATTSVAPGVLKLGYFEAGGSTTSARIVIRNLGTTAMSYTVTNVPAATVDAAAVFQISYANTTTTVSFDTTGFSIPAKGSVTLGITFTNAATNPGELFLFSGYIKVTPTDSDPQYYPVHVAYAGLWGDPAAYVIQVPVDVYGPMPFLVDGQGIVYNSPDENATFTFNASAQDFPTFYMETQRPARSIGLKLFEYTKSKLLGFVDYYEYYGVSGPGKFLIVTWQPPGSAPSVRRFATGNPVRVPVPNGSYYVIVEAAAPSYLKKPAEVWRSPKIIINAAQ